MSLRQKGNKTPFFPTKDRVKGSKATRALLSNMVSASPRESEARDELMMSGKARGSCKKLLRSGRKREGKGGGLGVGESGSGVA